MPSMEWHSIPFSGRLNIAPGTPYRFGAWVGEGQGTATLVEGACRFIGIAVNRASGAAAPFDAPQLQPGRTPNDQ